MSLKPVTLSVVCGGRNPDGGEVFERYHPVKVDVLARVLTDRRTIGVSVACPHNGGPNGEYCEASGEAKVPCAYTMVRVPTRPVGKIFTKKPK